MTIEHLSDAEILAIKEQAGSIRQAAKQLGCVRSTLSRRLLKIGAEGKARPAYIPPTLEESELPAEDIIARNKRSFERRKRAEASRLWMEFKVKDKGPFALVFVGDPHMDDNGCNWSLLERDVAILRDTEAMYGIGLGDYTNNWSGRLQRIYADQQTTRSEAHKLAEWFFGQKKPNGQSAWWLLLKGNHDCLDPETEVFTRRGWLRYDDLLQTDEVFGIDTETDLGRWQPITEIIKRQSNGFLNHLKITGVDVACTDRHRVLHRHRPGGGKPFSEYRYASPSDLSGRIGIPVSAVLDAPGASIDDDEIALAGWFLTDGWFESKRGYVRFGQSKDHRPICDLLDAVGMAYTTDTRQRDPRPIKGVEVKSALPFTTIRVAAKDRERFCTIVPAKDKLPDWAWQMDGRQFRVLLNSLMAGDGTWYGDVRKGGMLYGTERLLDEVQALCHMHGFSAIKTRDGRGDFRLNICQRRTREMDVGDKVKRREYDGPVWCLTVPLSNFMVRRNGAVYFTGNSWSSSHGNGDVLDWMQRGSAALEDWQAQFVAVADKVRVPVWAAHDFKGSSIWNPLHGPMRKGALNSDADIYVCGDKHNWGLTELESQEQPGRIVWSIRARGYKFIDSHASRLGFGSQDHGASIAMIVDPDAEGPNRVRCIPCLEEARDYLAFKRRNL